jgi:hypothetical protein
MKGKNNLEYRNAKTQHCNIRHQAHYLLTYYTDLSSSKSISNPTHTPPLFNQWLY